MTVAGIRAKARAARVLACQGETEPLDIDGDTHRLVFALLEDLAQPETAPTPA